MVSYKIALRRSGGEWFVLILIVMDNGLLRRRPYPKGAGEEVLILIVMDNGLLPLFFFTRNNGWTS